LQESALTFDYFRKAFIFLFLFEANVQEAFTRMGGYAQTVEIEIDKTHFLPIMVVAQGVCGLG